MPQVVVVGAGFYGLIVAKTYLQVVGAYKGNEPENKFQNQEYQSEADLLVIDSASDIGGTWSRDRLYPNLLSQNSYGNYEFSDLPLNTAVPDNSGQEAVNNFIPGWKINRYLHLWAEKWDLKRRIRLNWKVTRVSRLPSKEWTLDIIDLTEPSSTPFTITCDKLILATGVTSELNVPDIAHTGDHRISAVHARDVGKYCRENFEYQPIPQLKQDIKEETRLTSFPKSVAVYGGAKSAFDLVHLFASLHRNSASFNIKTRPAEPIQVHWIIRNDGYGPAWMVRPTTQLGKKQVPGDQPGCTRIVAVMTPCVYEIPKQITWSSSCFLPRIEGSWVRRLLHGNPLGRAAIAHLWKQVDADIHAFANYDSHPKMQKLRPAASAIECTSPGGIANHPDLWETIRDSNVHIHRSSIIHISSKSPDTGIDLSDGTHIPAVDLLVYATGWKFTVSISFDPPALGAHLGLPCQSGSEYDWEPIERKVESKMRSFIDASLFKHAVPRTRGVYHLFRRIASPSLIAEGDRSFAVMGALYNGAVSVVGEVQALWAVAFLTGGLDEICEGPLSNPEKVFESVAEDVVWSRLTGTALNVDTLPHNDMLMRDLGLNRHRAGGRWWKELVAVYGPRSYAGIVDEWMEMRAGRRKQSTMKRPGRSTRCG